MCTHYAVMGVHTWVSAWYVMVRSCMSCIMFFIVPSLVEKGGDWERRNLLGVYEAAYLIITREIKSAAKLLMDAISTFGCYELFSYNQFVFYTVITAVVALDRPTLRDKVSRDVTHGDRWDEPISENVMPCRVGISTLLGC